MKDQLSTTEKDASTRTATAIDQYDETHASSLTDSLTTLMANRSSTANNAFLPYFQQQQARSLSGIPAMGPQISFNEMVGRPTTLSESIYLQQLLAMQAGISQASSLGAQFNTTSSLPSPSPRDLRKALATIAAATGMPGGTNAIPVHATVPRSLPAQVLPLQANSDASASEGAPHPPVLSYMECDEESLSEYQCLLRKQIELFEATSDDVQWNAQGRNKAIVLGQVGIRCRYCARLATWARARGAVYYSATLDGLYQAAQNMAKNHLGRHCRLIPTEIKNELLTLRNFKRRAAGGKSYWGEGARVLGVIECKNVLRFKNSTTGIASAATASTSVSGGDKSNSG